MSVYVWIGIAGGVNIGESATIGSTTDSTSTNSGSIQTNGGVGGLYMYTNFVSIFMQ